MSKPRKAPFKERWLDSIEPLLPELHKLPEAVLAFIVEAALVNNAASAHGFIQQKFNNLAPTKYDFAAIGRDTKTLLQLCDMNVVWAAPILENIELYPVALAKKALQKMPMAYEYHYQLRNKIYADHMREEFYPLLKIDEFITLVLGREKGVNPGIKAYYPRLAEEGGFEPEHLLLILSVVSSKSMLKQLIELMQGEENRAYTIFSKVALNIRKLK